jgi:hypothetical protein
VSEVRYVIGEVAVTYSARSSEWRLGSPFAQSGVFVETIREAEARKIFEATFSPSGDDVERAKHFIVNRVDNSPAKASALIKAVWVEDEVSNDKDFGFCWWGVSYRASVYLTV